LVHSSDEEIISNLINNPIQNAQNLMSDISPLMQKFGFSDLNLDIESFNEASSSSQSAFTDFVREIKKIIESKKLGTLSIDISPSVFVKPYLINPYDIGQIVDRIIIMGYDYNYSGSYLAGPVAPAAGTPKNREYDLDSTISFALANIESSKLILGLPFYGYEWETISDTPGSPTIPGGASTASIKRVETLLANCLNCQKGFDNIAQSPYIIMPDENSNYFHQIFYENNDSLNYKINLAKKYKLAGIALWALGYEDSQILEPLSKYKNNILVRLFEQ
jgi:spore germination protein YaaH